MTVAATLQTAELPQTRKARPILWFAGLGVVFLGILVWAYIGWFTDPESFRAVPFDAAAVPTSTKIAVRVCEVASMAGFFVAVWWGWRTSRADRRLSWDASFLIAWMSLMWADTAVNYVRPLWFYNAYFFNRGGWNPHIPGWLSPNQQFLPEPILFYPASYAWLGLLAIAVCGLMGRVKQRWPAMGTLGVVLTGMVVMGALNFVIVFLGAFFGVWSWGSTVSWLSLFGDKPFQFPLYDPVLFAVALWGSAACLRYFRDDRGRSMIERGVDDVRIGQRSKAVLRILALAGFLNLGYLLYAIATGLFALHANNSPHLPNYLNPGICGPGTGYACPAPDQPIPVRGAPKQS